MLHTMLEASKRASQIATASRYSSVALHVTSHQSMTHEIQFFFLAPLSPSFSFELNNALLTYLEIATSGSSMVSLHDV